MFTKKAVFFTLLSILFSLTYDKRSKIPPSLVRPLLVVAVVVVVVGVYLYQKGYFSESKIVDTIASRVDEPFGGLKQQSASEVKQPVAEEKKEAPSIETLDTEKSGLFKRVAGGDDFTEPETAPEPEADSEEESAT